MTENDLDRMPEALRSIDWVKGPPAIGDTLDVDEGDTLLVAVARGPADETEYEFAVVTVTFEEDRIELLVDGCFEWGWTLDDIDWYVVIE